MIETQFNKKIRITCSDNEKEFEMKSFYIEKGIIYQKVYVKTSEHNDKEKGGAYRSSTLLEP